MLRADDWPTKSQSSRWPGWIGAFVGAILAAQSALAQEPYPVPAELLQIDLSRQTVDQAGVKSAGCVRCHAGACDPHVKPSVRLGCTDCHGGNAQAADIRQAHEASSLSDVWTSSANPVRSYTALNYERPEFIRFVNPGDLRVAHLSCGTTNCHPRETLEVRKSMMTHGCMLWNAALYNNGAVPHKWARFGESYSMHGKPQRLQTVPPPTPEETDRKGVLPYLDPLPRFQVTQPSNILRIFEPGARFAPEIGIPERLDDPGKSRIRLSVRGLGTGNRTDPVFIGLQKTRLFDPTLNFLGTNDHPGDYRSSGCTACHMIYANDRSPIHSGPYAKYGHLGQAATRPDEFVKSVDPMIPQGEAGHPIAHRFTRAIPSSQCIVCHIHPGTTVVNTYLGYTWWDLESDAECMYPAQPKKLTSEEFDQTNIRNPEETAARGNWGDPQFLANLTDLNPTLKSTQFADFYGHGWVFRAVFKKDRHGNFLDHDGRILPNVSGPTLQQAVAFPQEVQRVQKEMDRERRLMPPQEFAVRAKEHEQQLDAQRQGLPVHMLDVHLEKGMHCVDCHFAQDVHGNTKLYGEVRAAIEIGCIDCHGTIFARANLRTSGPAAPERTDGQPPGHDLRNLTTPFGRPRFELSAGKLIQNSMVEPGLSWDVKQVRDTLDPKSLSYNAKSALAKTIRFADDTKQQFVWGDVPSDGQACAHSTGNMSCIACHTSWNPSCFGCHLPQRAAKKRPDLHNEGDITRNVTSYNFQTLRDDVFMLARDGQVTGNKINPARSSCSIHVTSYNLNREAIYSQQQTISGEGHSGVAFSTNVPHTVRGRGETKSCTDCHVSAANDNNAALAQLLMLGTNSTNFMGRYCWTAAGSEGLFAAAVSELDEPQAVIGSTLHERAYPDRYKKHLDRDGELQDVHGHGPGDILGNLTLGSKGAEVLSVQQRGEYVYAACGSAGVRLFDTAFIEHKGFSQRIATARLSPAGQKFSLKTKYATSIVAPTTLAPDPTRTHLPENREQPVHGIYAYLYVTDLYEGVILIGAGTLLDGDPSNNFLKRALTFNPDGLLTGAKSITFVGHFGYICCDAGLVVVSFEDPLHPEVMSVLGSGTLNCPTTMQAQFRYGFVCDAEGLTVLDLTQPEAPKPVAKLPLECANNVYVARTYAYVAGGPQGLIIVNVENPEQPVVEQIYDADGCINDLRDVKLAMTYVSQFAYLADGANGMRVVQLTSPETPGNYGFSPRPTPRLIATAPMSHGGCAVAISEALDRDRAVDESGHQIAVFGRVGARPFNREEQTQFYLRPDGTVWKVLDEPDRSFYGDPRPWPKRPVGK